MCRTTANSPCLSLDKYTTGCQSAPCSWKSETFIPFYGYTNSHWQLAKLLNLNRKVFSIHSKYAVQPVIIVARKPIYSEVWSQARMRVSLMSQRKYDSGVTKGTSSSSMLVRPEPSLKKSNISKMQILLSLSLLFSTVTAAFSSASSVYPQSVFWPASLPLSLWSDLLDKNGKKMSYLSVSGTHGWLMEISDLEAYIQAVRDTGKHGLWNAVMTISLTLFFLPIHSFNISPPSFFQLTWEESWKMDFVSHVSSPLPYPIHSMLSIFLHHSSTFLLPSPHCFCIFNRSTISYIIRLPPPRLLSHYVRFSHAAYSKHSAGTYLSSKMLSSSRMKGARRWFEIRGYLLSDWLCCLCGF